MTRKLRQIIACLTDDGDIFSVLNFVDVTGTVAPGETFQTDRGQNVTRIGLTEFYLTQTGQRLVPIRRGHDSASALH